MGLGFFEMLLLLGFVVVPAVVVVVVLLVLRARSVKCPHCLKRIPKGARVCYHCQREQTSS